MPFAIAASMFLAMLFLSLRLYKVTENSAAHVTITIDTEIVIKSVFSLYDFL